MATYARPVSAKLVVRLDNGEEWEANDEDYARFNLVDRHRAYMAFDDALRKILDDAGLISRDLTEARLNPLRYLVELSVVTPQIMADCADELADTTWADIVAIERALRGEA